MKKFLLAFILALIPSLAFAQCNGIMSPGAVCGVGNLESARPAHQVTSGSISFPIIVGTTIVTGGTSPGVLYNNAGFVGNSATVLIGTGSNPSLTINPTAGLGQGFYITQSGTGTASATPTVPGTFLGYAYNRIAITDNVAVTSNNSAFGLHVEINSTGVNATGRGAAFFGSTVGGSASGTSGSPIGVTTYSNVTANYAGGTTLSPAGSSYGFSSYGRAIGNNLHLTNVTGGEINVEVFGTSTDVNYVSGLQIAANDNHAVHGTTYDAVLSLSKKSTAIGANQGILFSLANGGHPVATTGTLIKTIGSTTVAAGIDISSYTISGNAWASPGATLSGVGDLFALTNATIAQLQLISGSNALYFYAQASGNVFMGTSTASTVGFITNNVNRGNIAFNAADWQFGTSGNEGTLALFGATSGSLKLRAPAIAGSSVLRFPNGSTDFSATGGTSNVVQQTSSGGAFTVARLACSDLSDATACATAGAALTKANDTNVTMTLGGSPTTSLLAATSLTLGWTGQLSVARGGTGLASGTSGGIPYFSGSTTIASSAALAASAIVLGGGAGVAPATTTTGTGVVTALGINVGSAGAFVTFNGALGTPSSGTVTNLTGTASININGTVGATTPGTGAFTTATASTSMTSPLYIGGSGTTGTQLTLKTTTGNGTTDAYAFTGGNNGGTTFATLQTGSFNIQSGSSYNINGTSVLNGTTLGSGITASSLTSVGTITSGTWTGTTVAVANGGTGDTGTNWLTSFTPTVGCATSGSPGTSSATARYKTLGKSVFVQIDLASTGTVTCVGGYTVTLPTTPQSTAVFAGISKTTSASILANVANAGSNVVNLVITAATGQFLSITGDYETQ